MYGFEEIEKVDKEIAECIQAEVKRQMSVHNTLSLFYHFNTAIFSNISCKHIKNMIV